MAFIYIAMTECVFVVVTSLINTNTVLQFTAAVCCTECCDMCQASGRSVAEDAGISEHT